MSPRYFPPASLPAGGDLGALVRWSQALRRFARQAEHPWIADLGVESLVEQGREALQTPRSATRGARV
jgi:DNA polymerase-3 subunit delta'